MDVDDDPNRWPRAQQRVLRWIGAHGGWHTAWPGVPTAAATRALERRLEVRITATRAHPHDPPWFAPASERDRVTILRWARRLEPEAGPWDRQ